MDTETLLDTIAKSTRRFIEELLVPLKQRIDQLETAVRDLLSFSPPDVDAIAERVWRMADARITAQIDERMKAVPLVVDAAVADAVADLPPVRDGEPGKDAQIDWPLIFTKMQEMVNALPRPRDGRDALDADQLREAIDKYAAEFFERITMTRTQIDARTFTDTITLPSGRTITQQVSVPAAIYQGTWREREYQRGDMVTRSGSIWHCNAEKTSTPPGDGNPDWQLAVKRGADGRDADAPRGKPPAVVALR